MNDATLRDVYGRTVVGVTRQYDTQLKPLGDLALAKLDAKEGEHIIDIGCGAAQTCLQIAETVGPSGSVLGIDLSPTMAEFAMQRTRAASQIRIVRGDAGTIAFKPSGHDALFSRFGVMAFADPVSTFSHLKIALKPNGRLAFVCWRGLRENELDYLPFDAAADQLPFDDAQGAETAYPFSFSDAENIEAVLRKSGFDGIECTAHDISVSAGDLDDTIELCLSAGALGGIVRRNPELRAVVTEPVRQALAARVTARGLFMNAAVWTVTANAK